MTKRLIDICLASLGIFCLLPLFIITAILIKIDSEGSIFFRQKRVGRHGKIFDILKFRTMSEIRNSNDLQITIGKDSRITKIGHFLRKYRIDELPQLFNVLKGDMSLVGPRPEVPEYVAHYDDKSRNMVLSIKPGITDLASIKYSDESSLLANESDPHKAYINKILPKKLRYYRFYVKNHSVLLDCKIIYMTLAKLISA